MLGRSAASRRSAGVAACFLTGHLWWARLAVNRTHCDSSILGSMDGRAAGHPLQVRCREALEQGNTGGLASCLRKAAAARNLLLTEELPHVARRLRRRPPTTPHWPPAVVPPAVDRWLAIKHADEREELRGYIPAVWTGRPTATCSHRRCGRPGRQALHRVAGQWRPARLREHLCPPALGVRTGTAAWRCRTRQPTNCFASLRATSRRKGSPVAIPRTPL